MSKLEQLVLELMDDNWTDHEIIVHCYRLGWSEEDTQQAIWKVQD